MENEFIKRVVPAMLAAALCMAAASSTQAQEIPDRELTDPKKVRFLATADPQYWEDFWHAWPWNRTATAVLGQIGQDLEADPGIMGVLVAGDLTMDTRVDEFSWYLDAIAPFIDHVYDGLGNHDLQEVAPKFEFLCGDHDRWRHCAIAGRVRDHVTRERATPTAGNDPHYSWWWGDVHFVQLNQFASDTLPPATGFGVDPEDSLSFLEADLAAEVGDSDAPVVIVHHYPTLPDADGEWSKEQKVLYWNAIATYNVVAIVHGHNHATPETYAWGLRWYRPQDSAVGPDYIPLINASASHTGVYLDMTVDVDAKELRVLRRGENGEPLSDSIIECPDEPGIKPYCSQERNEPFPTGRVLP